MDILTTIAHIIEIIVFGVVALAALLVVLMIAVSMMPKDNPLRQLLASLAKPVGVMVGAGIIGVPIEFIPGIDALYDIAALIFTGYSWMKFFQEAHVIWPQLITSFAAKAPPGDASLSAGECFARGQEALGRNAYAEALRWYRFAAERGHAGARKILDDAEATAERTRQQEQERQRQEEQARRQSNSGGKMTRSRALEILELAEGAAREQIIAAYTRLMKQVHPDKGGSNFFAKQLNEAREVLLG